MCVCVCARARVQTVHVELLSEEELPVWTQIRLVPAQGALLDRGGWPELHFQLLQVLDQLLAREEPLLRQGATVQVEEGDEEGCLREWQCLCFAGGWEEVVDGLHRGDGGEQAMRMLSRVEQEWGVVPPTVEVAFVPWWGTSSAESRASAGQEMCVCVCVCVWVPPFFSFGSTGPSLLPCACFPGWSVTW